MPRSTAALEGVDAGGPAAKGRGQEMYLSGAESNNFLWSSPQK
jgi:hypothetical protein